MAATGTMRRLLPDGIPRVLLIGLATLLLVPAASGVVSWFVTPGSATTLAPAALAPLLMAASVPSLLGFLLARQWWGALVAGLLSAVLVILVAPLYVADTAPNGARDVVVMNSNVRLGEANAADIVRDVRDHHVEVLMVQELTAAMQQRLSAAGLDSVLTHRIAEPAYGATGTGLWSRYPLTSTPFGPLTFHSVAARVTLPGARTSPTLVALHVAGPVPDATNWSADMDRLPAALRALPKDAPVIVGGDFNATASVSRFRTLLNDGYADAGSQAGAGLLRTYPSDRAFPPVLGIDHVLTRGGAVGTAAETLQVGATDHRSLLVRVAVPHSA